ncbi:hypothetical protein [Schaalia hyovaginalis]|uniref:hypothetical protein n=1 Tax=Schaalia hyovaginalis TaxID=29316 RepID=UPI002A759E9E|nr:hypothetical protein [Schaalia hyovaginalis]MDY2669720.1 hypothetical protein [Schaalia hyovaginalis]
MGTAEIASGTWAVGTVMGSPSVEDQESSGFFGWLFEYVEPLATWSDDLLGNPTEVEAVAASWDSIESSFWEIVGDLRSAEGVIADYEGRTVRALELRYSDLIPIAEDAAQWSSAAAAAARLASSIVAGTRGFIMEALAALEAAAKALFSFTLSPFEKFAELKIFVEAVYDLAVSAFKLISAMIDAFKRLVDLIAALLPLIRDALEKLAIQLSKIMPIAGGVAGILLGGVAGLLTGSAVLWPIGPLVGGVSGALMAGLLGTTIAGGVRDLFIPIRPVVRTADEKADEALKAVVDSLNDPDSTLDQEFAAARAQALQNSEIRSLADLVQANSLADMITGTGRTTAISVRLVEAADGSRHWVVALPSTQDWVDILGSGTMADRNTNVELVLMDNPVLKSQYERAVLRAMAEAGVAQGDPVVLTGFSQGGIMAANLAADPSFPYQTIGVVTNGSPIDGFTIPQDIPVVAFQHANDPVPMLDLNANGEVPENIHRVLLPGQDGIMRAHNNNQYADSVDRYSSDIYGDYEFMYGKVIEQQVFDVVQR